jgi:ferritin
MADSMEMAKEDLELLYDLAEMEWKKEFTTANITVDMSNYNTVNGMSDLDGIATYLRDGLIEEMSAVANGNYGF